MSSDNDSDGQLGDLVRTVVLIWGIIILCQWFWALSKFMSPKNDDDGEPNRVISVTIFCGIWATIWFLFRYAVGQY